MTTISIEEAQVKLPELIGGLAKGEELVIVQGEQVVARLVGARSEPRPRRVAGFAKGMLTIVAEAEDPLQDFEEYVP